MYKYVRPRNFYYGLLIGLGLFILSVLNRGISRHADLPNNVIRSPVVGDEVAFMYADTHQGLLLDDGTNHPPAAFDLRWQESIKLACTLEQTELPACYLLNDTDIFVPLRSIETAFELVSTVNLQAKTVTVRQTNVSIPLSKPDNHYATGSYMFFDQYDVEKRHHVKLVLADEGVPLSTQWSQRAYPYPIQIAQFGLSHYSKWAALTQQRTHSSTTSTSSKAVTDVDLLDSKEPYFVRSLHLSLDDRPTVYRFSVGASSEGLLAFAARAADSKLIHSRWRYFVLSGEDWHEGSYVKLRVLRSASNPSSWIELIYACGNAPPLPSQNQHYSISTDHRTATFWMPICANASRSKRSSVSIELARDLLRDLQKVFGQSLWRFESTLTHSLNEDNDGLIHVELVALYAGAHGPDGGGLIRLMRLGRPSSTESPGLTEILFHTSRFISAAKWFLRNQDSDGGWHIPVARQFRERPTIEPGWVSAMGQGQGISLLVRVYNYTKDMTYLKSAQRALGPFDRSVAQGGVRSYFLEQLTFPWFEEYPTRPGSHVLNGMIYSLVGLYDLSQVSPLPEVRKRSTQLWHSGLNSLSTLLPLFDSGSGSFYDLRHVTPATADIKTSRITPEPSLEGRSIHRGPNRARWSYHALHIRQLRLLASIDNDHAVQWSDTASRWTAYMNGTRSPHN
ncbi:hypothetical protein CRM22_006309 [Opisthorchis felineus]|uniref:D-glucuronyl C5-epimerase C-terminal domain-containing protein n=1 Tax=Opisthorchis felineus TaxID=147828 RepID=A0A4V3SEH8_OPIFE|nr:hypothetical protein CRM22_006309 [Opisthorchis felineus]